MKILTGLLISGVCLLIGSPVLSQEVSLPMGPPGITTRKVKWQTYTHAGAASSAPLGTSPDTNVNRLPLPTQSTGTMVVRTRLYVYSMELTNNGSKPIKALAWDFIFADAADHTELKQQSLANVQTIGMGEKKTLRFTTQAAPPRIVTVSGLEKDKRSPFTQSARIRCLLFTDDSVWEHPTLKGACRELEQWIARRKKVRLGVEDLPLKN